MDLTDMWYSIQMPDGKYFAIPITVIIKNRATYYMDEFDNDLDKSIKEDTLPLFESDNYEIADWAKNNMNWVDVEDYAVEIDMRPSKCFDYQNGWVNGDYEIIEDPK